MVKKGYLSKHRIVMNKIKEDIIYFGIPAIIVFASGLIISFMDKKGFANTLSNLITQPQNQPMFSIQNIVGLILLISGLSIMIFSQATLRKSYHSTLIIRENHKLITHGIYRFIRHPIYLGMIIASIGIPIFSLNLYGVLVMLIMIPVFLSRIRLEEKMLTEAFVDEYTKYIRTTKKLIPFIY